MPVQFLEQLFTTLRRDGLLQSHRGVKGGYTLARPAPRSPCSRSCNRSTAGWARRARRPAASGSRGWRRFATSFEATTIADIARREAEEAGAGMYHI